jgi:hypothetical protein
MRKRIIKEEVKVNINAIGMELKEVQDRRKKVFSDALRDVCNRDNVRISEAKVILRKELMWLCVKREMSLI